MRKILAVAAIMAALAGQGADATAPFNTGTRFALSRFVNSPDNARSAALRKHYVDFSFDYPAHWVITPQPADGSAVNYVRVAAPMIDRYEPFAFHVGHAYGTGNAESDRRYIKQALPGMARQFGSTIADYRITSMGMDRVGSYDSWSWRFSASGPSIDGSRPALVYGRGDIILPPGATRGVLLMTLVSDRTDEVASPADVGETGTIRAIFDSFRLGRPGGTK